MSVKYKKIEKLKTRIKDLKTLKYALMLDSHWKGVTMKWYDEAIKEIEEYIVEQQLNKFKESAEYVMNEELKFVKDDEGKLQYSLLPKDEIEEIVKVLQYGAKKYGRDNWKLCNDKNRYIDALYRHLEAYRAGEMLDKDDNLHHLAHLACNALFLLYFENNKESK